MTMIAIQVIKIRARPIVDLDDFSLKLSLTPDYNDYLIVGKCQTPYSEENMQDMYNSCTSTLRKSFFEVHEYRKALSYAFELDKDVGYTEHGPQKAPFVAYINWSTGVTRFGEEIHRLAEPTCDFLTPESVILCQKLDNGSYKIQVNYAYTDQVSDEFVSNVKNEVLDQCLLLMDKYPTCNVSGIF